jgi:hypothetical protein
LGWNEGEAKGGGGVLEAGDVFADQPGLRLGSFWFPFRSVAVSPSRPTRPASLCVVGVPVTRFDSGPVGAGSVPFDPAAAVSSWPR